MVLTKGGSPLQELKEDLRNGLFLLVDVDKLDGVASLVTHSPCGDSAFLQNKSFDNPPL